MKILVGKIVSIICIITMVLFSIPLQSSSAAEASTNPKPKVIPSSHQWSGDMGMFTISEHTRLIIPGAGDLTNTAKVFQQDLKEITGFDVPTVQDNVPDNPNDEPLPKIRYEQNFEDNQVGGWQHVIGTGSGSMALVSDPTQASQHALQLTAKNVNNVFIDQNSPNIKDGEIEFQITPTNTGNIRAGFIFRYAGKDAWASVGYDNGSWYWVNAQDNYGLMTNNAGAKLAQGVTSTVKVKFEGSIITLFVNGMQYYEGTLTSLPSVEGKMGARVFGPTVAIFDNFKYRNNVPDTAVPVTGVQLDKPSLSLKLGDTAELSATVLPENATNKNVSWKSSDENVAKIELIGGKATVIVKNAGNAKITVTTADGAFVAECVITAEVSSAPRLRVLTYNIHHGAGTDGVLNLDRIANVIKSANPDVVALQEVDVNVPRSGKVDEATELGKLTGMNVVFGKAIDLSGGEYGLAILSRFPISSSEKILLPNISGGEQRILLTAKIAPQNGLPEFTFTNTHLEYIQQSIQMAQVNKIVEHYGTTSPYILAGDLNATPDSDVIKTLTNKWTDATSNITDWTNLEGGKIDYVMYGKNNQWRVASAQVIHEDIASDHRPVLSVLEWQGSQEQAVTGVQLDKTEIALRPGESAELVVTVLPENASNKNVTWKSSDETVAKVETNGGKAVVTALKGGTANITVTTTEGGFTAVSKITVQADSGVPATTLSGASSATAGSTFAIRLGLKDIAQNVYGQDIRLSYDTSAMEFVSAKSLIEGVNIVESKDQAGTLRLIIASLGADHTVTGISEVIEIIFKAKDVSAPVTGTVEVTDATLGDDKGIETKAIDSSISIQVTPVPTGIPGDVNGDGKVTIGDLGLAAGNYGKDSTSPDWQLIKGVDINGDGKIDIEDLAAIARILIQ